MISANHRRTTTDDGRGLLLHVAREGRQAWRGFTTFGQRPAKVVYCVWVARGCPHRGTSLTRLSPGARDNQEGDNSNMAVRDGRRRSGLAALAWRFADLLGVGVHLLLLGLLLEGGTLMLQRWVSFSIPLTFQTRVVPTLPCIAFLLTGVIWFNRSLDLVEAHLRGGEKRLVTCGPFNCVRHPLYSTLLVTIPPLFVIWAADLLFLVPWVLIIVASHYVVLIEERGLIESFGHEYEVYRSYVPALLPYKGAGGRRYREEWLSRH
jgi:protein-S-isoprenylcysteine O-methyltransferase Ste14